MKASFPQAAFLGFTVLFSVALVSRSVSWMLLTRLHEVSHAHSDEERFRLPAFLGRLRRTNFGRFVIFVSFMNFATFIAAPFFTLYMLNDLEFSYFQYTVLLIASSLAGFMSVKMWGTHADYIGNRRIMRLTSLFIPFVPLLWLVSHNAIYIFIIQAFSGFFWAGFNLSVSNFVYDASGPVRRARYVAYFSVINGIAMFLGATIGGYLMRIVPPVFGYKALAIFMISGILRFAAWPLCSLFTEVRHVHKVSSFELFCTIVGLRSDGYSTRNLRW